MDKLINKVKVAFKCFRQHVKDTPNKKCVILCFGLLFISLALTFIAGSLSKKTEFEVAGHQISEIVKNDTKDGKYSYVLVESIDSSKPLPPTINEYRYWYNVFGESRNSFLGVVNGNKEREAYFTDFNQDKPLTFVYADVFSNIEYNGHWKHEYYHIELMFKGEHNYNRSEGEISFCYLTESQAKTMLGNDNPALEEYKSLIGEKINIMMDGVVTKWHIGNIILENNDVTDAINNLFDNWVLSYIHFPTGFYKQFCYIFNKYNFQNMYKLEYLHNNFKSIESYFITYGINNLNTTAQYSNIIDVLYSDKTSHLIGEAVLVILAFSLLVFAIYLLGKNNILCYKTNVLWIFASLILPYLIFYSLSTLLGNMSLFSYFGLIYYIISLCVVIVISLWMIFFKKGKAK